MSSADTLIIVSSLVAQFLGPRKGYSRAASYRYACDLKSCKGYSWPSTPQWRGLPSGSASKLKEGGRRADSYAASAAARWAK